MNHDLNPLHCAFLSNLNDDRSPQPCSTKTLGPQVNQNANSKHQFDRQTASVEKIVELPNGFRTVWKDQSYSYATGTFQPTVMFKKEKPEKLTGPVTLCTAILYGNIEEKWFV